MSTIPLGLPTRRSGLETVPALGEGEKLSKKDFTSGSEVRWCPGCGDYAILAAVQGLMPELGIKRENFAVISGIGCAARFPYYVDTYGMHSIHGRAPSIATGLAVARPDLTVWVVTGDGDALSIGGNHLIHALRRNVNITILLFNNRIYGLTKGQYSPTSEVGKVTKSSPAGSVDQPFNPISLALGAEASFVARTMDSDRKHLQATLKAAAEHRGSALVEIYQNCPIFNDGAYEVLKDADEREARIINLEHGQPITWGNVEHNRKALVRGENGAFEVVSEAERGDRPVVVHDVATEDPTTAFGISRLDSGGMAHVPMGIFRSVERPTYDDAVREQVESTRDGRTDAATDDELQKVLLGGDTWTVD